MRRCGLAKARLRRQLVLFDMLPFARWSIIAVVGMMGAALLLTAWTTYAGVEEASATMLRGEANALEQAVRSHLIQLGEPPTTADLTAILEDESGEGLRYLATFARDTGPQAEAGAAVGGALSLPSGPMLGAPVTVGGRVRVLFPIFGRRFLRRDAGARGRSSFVAMEFEPLRVQSLRTAAARTFGVGALSATTLLVVSLLLVRWVLRQAALERERERERGLASLGEMSAVLAHEIRNPLASLKGNAQLLAQMLASSDAQRPRADRVVDEAVRLETLVNDLLQYVRTGESHPAAIDPGTLLRESAEVVDAAAILVDTSQAPRSWPLDAVRMRQVLVNLLENAVQAGAPVRASALLAQGRLVFEVRDQGSGVAPEDEARIFEPFFTRRTRGTGLGLAVAKRVVEQHGGTISVHRPVDGGALFRVTLPAR